MNTSQDRHTVQDIENSQWLTLSKDEEVVWWGHPSLLPMIPTIAAGVIAAVIGIYATIQYHDMFNYLPLLLVPFGAGISLFEYVRHITVFYVVTTNKLVRKKGIYRRDTLEIRFDDIEHSRASQAPIERLFGFGDLQVATAGTAFSELILDNVSEPKRVASLLDTGQDLGRIPVTDEEENALVESKKFPSKSVRSPDKTE